MIKPIRSTANRVKYGAMLIGALAVAAAPLAYPASATAERVWDIELYDGCMEAQAENQMDYSIAQQLEAHRVCCEETGGVFIDDGYVGKCVAPPAEPASGSRQLPGNIHIPTDLATAPQVTKTPPRPIQDPSAIATVSTVSQRSGSVS
ncbi:hypothetical protein CQY20_17110 [Mycolicibacterium agri]|uniref:Uncharacterized protein n=1 Tax=Mycolicibacterium agri TaxID=36811 RepID=A0A2A7MZI7_MYCAG|nr:hypothetical protein [Mycolicibacterium agri]PEG37074.1 hypothetical protein CQY20_17110 [Mycolicibacterium agri]GFG52089.1 hypothetical protein MAGR_35300 [Mycolicibacterium agri]